MCMFVCVVCISDTQPNVIVKSIALMVQKFDIYIDKILYTKMYTANSSN